MSLFRSTNLLSWALPLLSVAASFMLLGSLFGPERLEDELRWSAVVVASPLLLWVAKQRWRDHKEGVSFAETSDPAPDDAVVRAFSANPVLTTVAWFVAIVVGVVGLGTLVWRTISSINDPTWKWGLGAAIALVVIGIALVTWREDRKGS